MTVRFGLLGTGHWAAETHAPGLVAAPDVDLVGIWGRDPAKSTALAERYATRAYGEIDALLADVDAVAVALPPDIQARVAVRAAAAGRHLLLDKPLALTVEAADAVVGAVERAGVSSVVFFTQRFVPAAEQWLQGLVRDGDWTGGHVSIMASVAGGPYAGSPWRQRWGALWDVGPHCLAQVLPVLGPVSRVAAGRGHGDTVHVVVTHASGAASTLALSLTQPPEALDFTEKFWGPRGVAVKPDASTPPVEAFGNAVAELVECVRDGRTAHRCDARFGRDVVAVLQQVQARLAEA